MKLDEFIAKYNGKKVDFDGAFGPQCVDLYRQYCKDVHQIPHTGVVDGAKDLYLNYVKLPLEVQYFDKKNQGLCGDVVVWNSSPTNKYGHVAIYLGTIDENNILVFEQDGFRQDGAKIKVRSSKNILGFLHFKG